MRARAEEEPQSHVSDAAAGAVAKPMVFGQIWDADISTYL